MPSTGAMAGFSEESRSNVMSGDNAALHPSTDLADNIEVAPPEVGRPESHPGAIINEPWNDHPNAETITALADESLDEVGHLHPDDLVGVAGGGFAGAIDHDAISHRDGLNGGSADVDADAEVGHAHRA